MTRYPQPVDTTGDTSKRVLTYAGAVGIAIALLLTAAVLLLTIPSSVFPSGPVVATVSFSVLTVLVAALAHRLGEQA
jgi:xanthine/uracil permease